MFYEYPKKIFTVIKNIYKARNNYNKLKDILKRIENKSPIFFIISKFVIRNYIFKIIFQIISQIIFNPRKIIKLEVKNKKIFYLLSFISLNYFVTLFIAKIINIYRYFISKNISKFILKKYQKKKNNYKIKLIPERKIIYDLSIAIPCYSRSKLHPLLLDKCLAGIEKSLKLTNISVEICIFDNASTHSINEILLKYKHLNIKCSREEKLLSPSDSWYKSVKLTSGNYVHIHSCDDEVDYFFYKNIEYLIINNKVDLIYTAAKYLREFNYEEARWGWNINWPTNLSILNKLKDLYINSYFSKQKKECYFDPYLEFIRHPMPSSSWIVKRKFYEKYGVTADWKNSLDLDLAYRLERYNKICYFAKNSFIYYRDHPYSGNNLDNPKRLKELKWCINKIKFLFIYKDTTIKEKYVYLYNYINYYFFAYFFIFKVSDYENRKEDENIKIVNKFIINKIFLNEISYKIFLFLIRRVLHNAQNIILLNKYHNINNNIFLINPFYLLFLIKEIIKEIIKKLIK